MQLREINQFVVDQMLLDFPLDDSPQGFNRIQLRTIRRKEHQLEVQILGQLSDFFGVVAGMVIQDDEDFFIRIGERLS